MLKPAVILDAAMTADAVLERLAMNGYWVDVSRPVVRRRLEALSIRMGCSVEQVARTLGRDPRKAGAAIRRQRWTSVLWYARELDAVLQCCSVAAPETPLCDVLELYKYKSHPTIALLPDADTALSTGILLDDGRPVAVSLPGHDQGWPSGACQDAAEPPSRSDLRGDHSQTFAGGAVDERVSPSHEEAYALPSDFRGAYSSGPAAQAKVWPRIKGPAFVPAFKPFEIEVGFGALQQLGVAGGPVKLPATPAAEAIDLMIELSAGPGIRALDGWTRSLRVPLDDILSAKVTFDFVGDEPAASESPLMSMLEIRYLFGGTVCGVAAWPLVIVCSDDHSPESQVMAGELWNVPGEATPVTFVADQQVPDLTIEITKPDRNASSGQYSCRFYSPHALATPRGPFPMDLGQDAKTFAKAIAEEMRVFADSELLGKTLEGIGRLVAQCLPAEVFDALEEVAADAGESPPAVLIVSAEPYVPWELAWLDEPLDASRPSYLGAQALVGRWLRDARATTMPGLDSVAQRPATHPLAKITVRHIATMAAWYKPESGLCRLRNAELEAQAIVSTYGAIALDGNAQSMRRLLDANLVPIGAADALHFAGHGDFDPTQPDASALFLEDGTPLRSTQFRAARYGGALQPLLFLNACMLGVGGQLLGDMAGFPGSALRGGFGGVLGALWEIDDAVAHEVALEFWRRALPPWPRRGEPIGAILRDLRARYVCDTASVPEATYLAYVFYGHPRLMLERAAPAASTTGP